MKIRSSDCLYILRRFDIASQEHVPRDVSRLSVKNPSPTNTLAEFRFDSANYILLVDDVAEDDEAYIDEQISSALPGRSASLVANPQSNLSTYALPYEGKSVYLLKIDADKRRLDSHLADTRPELSRSSWQKYIQSERVAVDGVVQTSPKYAIDSHSIVTVDVPELPTHDDRQLPIIYIDDDVIVIDKPAGVLTHSKNQLDHEFTVADFLRRYTTHGEDSDRAGVVHRLDRDTSGLIIGARHQAAFDSLKSQFANRQVVKTYHAVVDGQLGQPSVQIDLPIARNSSRPGTFTVKSGGKSAQTKVRVLRSGVKRSLLELQPHTGRTHQLRVHMASLGISIVGDRLYGKTADRLYLHATKLEFDLPSGERRVFESPTPGSFMTALEQER